MAVGLPPQEVVLRWEPPPVEGGAFRESCRSAAMSGVVSLAADGVGGGGSRGVLGVVAACDVQSTHKRLVLPGSILRCWYYCACNLCGWTGWIECTKMK